MRHDKSKPTCKIKNCDKHATSLGMCGMHYNRVKRYGDPQHVTPRLRGVCSVEDCSTPHHSHGMCLKHWRRTVVHGNPHKTHGTPTVQQWAWLREALSRETDECIFWPFGRMGSGYGVIVVEGGVSRGAHRVVCELQHGAAPDETMQAAHNCGRAACVNKRHLRWATPQENAADKLKHGTHNRGERHGAAKLTADDVKTIRDLLGSGSRQQAIADRFQVQIMTISNINTRKTWGWL